MRHHRRFALVLVCLWSGCGDDDVGGDPDSGRSDAGTAGDAGARDAGGFDSSTARDAGTDGGVDAGSVIDAATDAAGATDAPAAIDAATDTDAGPACAAVAEHAISEVPGGSGFVDIVHVADGFGVVWVDTRSGVAQLTFARLDADGVKVGADIPVTSGATAVTFTRMDWTGSEYGVTLGRVIVGRPEPDLFFVRLDATGTLLGAEVPVGAGANPRIVWTGTHHSIVYESSRSGVRELYLSRFDATGVSAGADVPLTAEAGQSYAPSLAWTGSGYGVAFMDLRTGLNRPYFLALDASGAPSGAAVPVSAMQASAPLIAWDGSGFAITFLVLAGGQVVRVDGTGTPLAAEVTFATTPYGLVWSGTEHAIVTSTTLTDGFVDLLTVTPTGAAARGPLRVSSVSGMAPGPVVTFDGARYAVAWRDMRSGTPEVFVALVCPP